MIKNANRKLEQITYFTLEQFFSLFGCLSFFFWIIYQFVLVNLTSGQFYSILNWYWSLWTTTTKKKSIENHLNILNIGGGQFANKKGSGFFGTKSLLWYTLQSRKKETKLEEKKITKYHLCSHGWWYFCFADFWFGSCLI